jgi:acetylornithine aminotransferase
LACAATLSVLKVITEENLMQNASDISDYFQDKARDLPKLKATKGRGLMLGLEFDFPISDLRKELIFKHHIFTGGSKNQNLIRILPPLTIQKKHIDSFFEALTIELN